MMKHVFFPAEFQLIFPVFCDILLEVDAIYAISQAIAKLCLIFRISALLHVGLESQMNSMSQ